MHVLISYHLLVGICHLFTRLFPLSESSKFSSQEIFIKFNCRKKNFNFNIIYKIEKAEYSDVSINKGGHFCIFLNSDDHLLFILKITRSAKYQPDVLAGSIQFL